MHLARYHGPREGGAPAMPARRSVWRGGRLGRMLGRVRAPGAIVAQRYEIVDRLAGGGMGVVFKARHLVSKRVVALKLLLPRPTDDQGAADRFRREASVAARIGHEGIVEVLDAGIDADGTRFLAMELLEGESLRARLEHPDTMRGQALALVDATLEPLAAAHAQGFVHRDLKPENVFVTREGRVKLLDFGIAKDLASESRTLTGTSIGTPQYMAPEQVMSAKGASPASDVWSVGVMLYEILAGRPPFVGPTPHAVVVRACVEEPPPLVLLATSVGPRLAALVSAALAKDPTQRPADARVLRDALREAIAEDPDSSSEPVVIRTPEPSITHGTTVSMVSPLESRAASQVAGAVSSSSRTPASGSGWRRVERPRFSISLPPGWSEQTSLVPNAAALFVADATAQDLVPTQLRLKIEPFDGDTRAYADLGVTNLAEVSRVVRVSDAILAGMSAVDVEAVTEAEPFVRTTTRAAARDGTGYVAHASAPADRWSDVAPVLRAILGTLRLPRT